MFALIHSHPAVPTKDQKYFAQVATLFVRLAARSFRHAPPAGVKSLIHQLLIIRSKNWLKKFRKQKKQPKNHHMYSKHMGNNVSNHKLKVIGSEMLLVGAVTLPYLQGRSENVN
jgi:hypothetical protein